MLRWLVVRWSDNIWQKKKLKILQTYKRLTDLDTILEEIYHLKWNMFLNEKLWNKIVRKRDIYKVLSSF